MRNPTSSHAEHRLGLVDPIRRPSGRRSAASPFIPMAAAFGGAGNTFSAALFCRPEYLSSCTSATTNARASRSVPINEASGVEGHAQPCESSEDYLRQGSGPWRYERMAEGTQIAVAGIKPGLASPTRAAAGLQSSTSLGFLARASGIAGQSSPLSRMSIARTRRPIVSMVSQSLDMGAA